MQKPAVTPVKEYKQIGINLSVTEGQQALINSIRENIITLVSGEAGTGKTLITIAEALFQMETTAHPIEKIAYIRPAVQAQEDVGFLPGSYGEKIDAYMCPFYENALKLIPKKKSGKNVVEEMIEVEDIELMTLAFARGRTFDTTFMILDEAQNITKEQLRLMMSRIGRRTKLVILGDVEQSDFGRSEGLTDAIIRFDNVPGCNVVYLGPEDCMRSGIVRIVNEAYRKKIVIPR